MAKENVKKEEILLSIMKFSMILGDGYFFKKLQECVLHILAVDNGRIIESINIKEGQCSKVALKLQGKYWNLAREIMKGKKDIKLVKKTFPMSKGALLAKMFIDCIGKNFSEVISSRILDKKIEVTEEDYRLISNIPAFVVLCLLLSEFWKADADHDDLEKIGSLVISNQDKEENLVTIFNILLGEI